LNLNTIGKRIGLGYAVIGIVIAACLAAMHIMTSGLLEISRRAGEVRAPTAEAATQVLVGIADIQPALRRWILNRDQESLVAVNAYLRDRIDLPYAKLTDLSRHWIREQNKTAFQEFRSRVGELRSSVQALEKSKDQRAALRELDEKLAPLADYLRERMEILIRNQTKDLESDLGFQEEKLAQVEWMRASLIAIVLLISVVAGLAMSRAVGGPLSRAVELADLVARGNFSTKIEVSGTEEISRLGMALERMRANLERQNWIQQSQIRFHEAVRGATSLGELADSIAATVAQTTQATVAAFYMAENRTLRVMGGFALPKALANGSEIPFGQGIAGQAASDGRLVSVAAESPCALELSTVVGNIKPKEVLAAPLVFRDELVGVLELASVASFGPKEREFVQLAAQAAAIALNSGQKAEQVRNLLAETQTQSEELQSQQEELRNTNEELQTRQEELEASNEELEEQKSQLEQQKQALDQKNEALDQVSKYKSEFLANMSHELRTPLNSQLILSALLAENKEGNLTVKQLEYARTINASGHNLLQLINDILDLSKVEAGKLAIEAQEVAVAEIMESLRLDFQGAVEQKGLKLVTEVDPALAPTIQTDPFRLGQVLRNLLSNALKFTDTGEIRVRVAASTGQGGEKMAAFQVTDTGVGIPSHKLDAIFEAFEQVDSSTSRKYGGTGLGLAISKALAGLLGGHVQVTSKVGVGSAFTVTVPCALPAALGQAGKMISPGRMGEPRTMATGEARRVLVVDDEALHRDQIIRTISDAKVIATGVATAEEAFEALKREGPFDCMVLDLKLPGQTGMELLKRIHADKTAPRPSVVIHTAKDLTQDEEEQLRRYSDSIIIKGARSNDRLLEEVSLCVHQGQREFPGEQKNLSVELSRPDPLLAGKKVLLVDDDIRNVFSMSSAMEEKGIEVLVARNGAEAIEALKANPGVQLVLMDVMMPVMDGYEAMRRIRSDPRHALLPMIALTAKAMKGDKEACLEAGANDHLAKPVALGQFFALLRVWLSK
jgi:two-component system, chemotaxis family, sensor kinase CheA